jgi:two-component system, NarL family, sensor histidine kinase UhpB
MSIRSLAGRFRSTPRLPVRLRPSSVGFWARSLSTFEKVVVANSAVIILDTLAGWWITQHDPETYHYLIDTSFIALAGVLGLIINFALLRAAFAPLQAMLVTIRAIAQGNVDARVVVPPNDADALALAHAFNAMLDQLTRMRDDAAAGVLRAQEEERRQVALELHDQTGQNLTALALHAQAIAQQLASIPDSAAERARTQVERLNILAQQTLLDVQILSRQLRPPLLDDRGLEAALRWLARDSGDRLGVQVLMRSRGFGPEQMADERLPGEMETALFRIAQECLTNAARHGRAQHVWIVLSKRARDVTLTVADDGSGFVSTGAGQRLEVPHQGRQQRHGLGLEGMRERTRLLGGHLIVRSAPGTGCVVRAVVPLLAEAALRESTSSNIEAHV